jgi:hypothetical protein
MSLEDQRKKLTVNIPELSSYYYGKEDLELVQKLNAFVESQPLMQY